MAKLVCVMVLVFSALVGVSVAASPDLSDLDFRTELAERQEFPASDFIFKFPTEDQSTKFGNLRNLFINNDPILATLPHGGVAQNLVTLEACAVNQPHSHPRGTEISFVTEGTSHCRARSFIAVIGLANHGSRLMVCRYRARS
jgi:hypothetical protein